MKLEITITKEELLQAAENLVYTQSLDKDTEVDEEAIAGIIKEHLEKVIEDILSDPENYLKPKEWTEVNKCFTMPYSAYQKMMEQDIPYSL